MSSEQGPRAGEATLLVCLPAGSCEVRGKWNPSEKYFQKKKEKTALIPEQLFQQKSFYYLDQGDECN